jgi:hypothetical protein
VVNRVKSVAYSTETVKIFRSYDNLVQKVMPTIYLCNIIQFYFMTSAKTYQWVLPHVFHAISRDVIRNFHTLFHTCCGNSHTFSYMLRKSLTLFHTFSHMLRKFAHCSACIHTVWNTFRIPTYGVLFRMNPHCMEYEKALVSSYYHIIMID